jgi:hypothetical protein
LVGPSAAGGRGYWLSPDDIRPNVLSLGEMGAELFDYMDMIGPELSTDPLFVELTRELGWV